MRDAAAGDLGVVILPEWLVSNQVASGELRVLLSEWETAPVIVSGVFRTEMRGAPRVRALLDHLAATYSKEQAGTLVGQTKRVA
jgi:DNA-binding transcriptional LysR family regulator